MIMKLLALPMLCLIVATAWWFFRVELERFFAANYKFAAFLAIAGMIGLLLTYILMTIGAISVF